VLAAGLVGFTVSGWQGIVLAEVARVAPPERVAEATSGACLLAFLVGYALALAALAAAVSAAGGGWTVPLLALAAQLALAAASLAPRLRAASDSR
jgi:hypothetical protein